VTDDLREFVIARLGEQEKRLWHMRKQVIEHIWCAFPSDMSGWRIGIANGQADGWTVARGMEQAAAEYIVALATPDQVRVDLASKRRIIARHAPAPGGEELAMPLYCAAHAYRHRDGTVTFPVQLGDCPELRDLAVPYAWHPDYRTEWKP
jgi:hypothetical protein